MPSTQKAAARPAESASRESGDGQEAQGQARSDGMTPQVSLAEVAAIELERKPLNAKPQCGAPTKLRMTQPYVTCISVAFSEGLPSALRSGASHC
eukprot:CAMPEP_0185392124 /NCGR_PEP_ID=MMETSP1364-20130426/75766_1 /TAXON_ID=38817 /ORGANISM="Gephyrocapsa oceanica, Strain RCC1303" /LENGTH=94 /DNA_ID=CAMNT_0027994153 /DNA_START=231 /DNA_END=512 /DNA_ORIENTATION=+